jgi:hypothetical protein
LNDVVAWEEIGIMDASGEHHVARIDDTVTSANLHERAEAVAVPDFNYLEQTFQAIAVGLTGNRKSASSHKRRSAAPAAETTTGPAQDPR